MTEPTEPTPILPATGGSYIRQKDGSLVRIEEAAPPEQVDPDGPPDARAAKTRRKES